MSRWVILIGICIVSVLCILSFFLSEFSRKTYSTTDTAVTFSDELISQPQRIRQNEFQEKRFPRKIYNATVTISDVLIAQRQRISEEMQNFEYPSGCFGNTEKLTDLIIEANGNPVRSIILSTWRSGSTFLGQILNSVPGNYYHYEPIINIGMKQVRGPPDDQKAINNIIKLLKCDYNNMSEYLEYDKEHQHFVENNQRLWLQCKEYPQFCWQSKFLTSFCKLFPLQSMKVLRLRLALAERLFSDQSLNVRLLLLVRDPRGTMQSRKHQNWCLRHPDCGNETMLCRDLVSDYAAAQYLLKKYPSHFRTLRYEDLSLNPYEMTQEILQFYGLPFDPLVKRFLDTHTKIDSGDWHSTFRNSKSTPFHWIKDLTRLEIQNIELSCTKSMSLWGYRQFKNSDNFTSTFDPLIIPPPFT